MLLVTGCGGLDFVWLMATQSQRDVTKRPEYWQGFKYDETYVLVEDCFLVEISDWSRRMGLERTNCVPGGFTISSSQYLEAPEHWPEIKGVVGKGTHIQCKKMVSYGAPGFGRALFLFGEIVDGPHKGKLVDMCDLGKIDRSRKAPRGEVFQIPDERCIARE
jgi:hypothetical protein